MSGAADAEQELTMRALVLAAGMVLSSSPAWCGDIVDVLVDSNQQRLRVHQRAEPDSPRAVAVRATWQRLVATARPEPAPELVVVTGPLYAEAVMGRTVIVSEAVGDLPEGQRLMMLAHELGHVVMHHWDEQCELYKRFIPGEVKPETTDPVAGRLGAAAHGLAHRHEFEADAFGYALARRQGVDFGAAMALLVSMGMKQDTATHPGTHRRIAQLRQIEARATLEQQQAAAPAEPQH